MSAPADPAGPRRALSAGAALGSMSQAVVVAAGAVTGIIVARVLGAAGTGAYNLMFQVVALLTPLFCLGIATGVSYRVGRGSWLPGDALHQLRLAVAVLGGLGIAAGLGFGVVGDDSALEDIPMATLVIALVALPFALLLKYEAALLLAVDRYELYASTAAAQSLLALALVAVLAPTAGVRGAVAGFAISYALAALLILFRAQGVLPRESRSSLRRALAELRETVRFGAKVWVTNGLQALNLRADVFILNAVAAPPVLGHYTVAVSIASLGLLLPRTLSTVLLPRVAALDASREADQQRLVIRKSVRHAIVLVALTIALLAAIMPLVPLIYGAEFEDSTTLGVLLLPGIASMGVASVLSGTVVGKGRPDYSLYGALVTTPVTLVLYFVLVPELQAEGAAIASSISYFGTLVLTYLFFRRVSGLTSARELVPGRDELRDYRAVLTAARRRLT